MEQVIEEVTVDYYKTEDYISGFEASYPEKFNKMDYMGAPATRVSHCILCAAIGLSSGVDVADVIGCGAGSCCRIRLIAEQILPHIDSVNAPTQIGAADKETEHQHHF